LVIAAACTEELPPSVDAPIEDSPTLAPEVSEAPPAEEPAPDCLSPAGIRRMLLRHSNPDIEADYFDAAEVQSQGFCCGPGYVITVYDLEGPNIVGPTRFLGAYRAYEPDPAADSTFTEHQWIKYSRFEARRCRRSN
jgi:hypothetical protein